MLKARQLSPRPLQQGFYGINAMKDTRWWGAVVLALSMIGYVVANRIWGDADISLWFTGGLLFLWPMKEK